MFVTCSKCGETYETAFCPKDGTKLQPETPPDMRLVEYLRVAIKKADAFLEKNGNSEDAKIQKGLPTRRTKLGDLKQFLQWVEESQHVIAAIRKGLPDNVGLTALLAWIEEQHLDALTRPHGLEGNVSTDFDCR